MPGDLMISISFNGEDGFVDTYQIPYNTTWADLEAMLKAQFDCERISVSYIDGDNDEISVGSQDELFEAFRVAMASRNTLTMKVMSLAAEAAVFRISDDVEETEEHREDEPFDVRDSCPDPSVAIPMPDIPKEAESTIDATTAQGQVIPPSPQPQGHEEPASPQPQGHVDSLNEIPIRGIVFPDSNLQLVCTSDPPCRPQPRDQVTVETDDETSPVQTDEQTPTQDEDKPLQPLQYTDFVSFMTKLKKELRSEIVRDVTRKTVKNVLKGLDGAVIESLQGSSVLGAKPKGAVKPERPTYVHDGVVCDVCSQSIVGPRYKCGNCLDYDLCEVCEATEGVHNPDHVFVKIRRPLFGLGMVDGVRKPLLRSVLYWRPKQRSTKLVVPIQGDEADSDFKMKLENELQALKEDKRRKKDERRIEKLKKKEEKLKRRLESQQDFPLKREKLELLEGDNTVRYDFYKLLMSAQFLHDMSVPDGTKSQPDTKFVKTWQMKNDGDGKWSESTKLHLLWGNIQTTSNQVSVPHLGPGEEGTISVEFVSPSKPGEYQSHWKLYEHGMQFGARVWCSIVVVEREMLEPSEGEKDSLKIVDETETEKPEEPAKEEPEQIEITFRPVEEEHLRAVAIKSLEPVTKEEEPVTQDVEPVTQGEEETEGTDSLKAEVVEPEPEKQEPVKQEVEKLEPSTKGEGGSMSEAESGEGFVMYTKSADTDAVVEVTKDKVQSREVTLETDLSTAVARLSLDTERKDGATAVSMTPTPTNTPFDVTPLKTPNPEPEDELVEPSDLKPISNSSSVEFVAVPEGEEQAVNTDTVHEYIQQKMAGLELKPDIDLESVSSYSDEDEDDDSSLSDSDYIIVPMPECFDITRPIMSQSILSSYSTSTVDRVERDFSIDDNQNGTTLRSSRAVSIDDILSTSSSLVDRPLSPSPGPSENSAEKGDNLVPQEASLSATGSAGQDPQSEVATPCGKSDDNQASSQPGDITGAGDGVSSLTTAPITEGSNNNEYSASGAASAQSENMTEPAEAGEITSEQTDSKEPISASAHTPENVRYVRKSDRNSQKSVDFAPEFANQLMETAVTAAGQAYITVKAVFKTWQDKQAEGKHQNKPAAQSQGWKPASTQFSPPTGDQYKPPKSDWKPPKSDFKPPQSDWKLPASDFKLPADDYKPPTAEYKPPAAEYKPPTSDYKPPTAEYKPTVEEYLPPPPPVVDELWHAQKDFGPMGKLFDMGFYDRELNTNLLNKYDNDLERVIRELLSRKNADWSV